MRPFTRRKRRVLVLHRAVHQGNWIRRYPPHRYNLPVGVRSADPRLKKVGTFVLLNAGDFLYMGLRDGVVYLGYHSRMSIGEATNLIGEAKGAREVGGFMVTIIQIVGFFFGFRCFPGRGRRANIWG